MPQAEAPTNAPRSPHSERNSASAEIAADLLELTFATDVRETPADVFVPTLVVHRRRDRAIRHAAEEQLAALIPNAELALLETTRTCRGRR